MVTFRNRKFLRLPAQATLLLCFFLISYLFVRSAGIGMVSPETVSRVVQDPPKLYDYLPVPARAGQPVMVRGKNFTDAVIQSDCANIAGLVVSDSVIMITFPATCGSQAMVVVRTLAGQVQFVVPFETSQQQLPATVDSLRPISGTKGTWITIRGHNFLNVSKVTFNNRVYGNTAVDSFAVANDSVIYAVISKNTNWGNLQLDYKTGGGTSFGHTFSYPGEAPDITSYTGMLMRGNKVTITGANLGAVYQVFLGSDFLTNVTVINESRIEATVGRVKHYNGYLYAETPHGMDSIGTPVPPTPYAAPVWFTPASGKEGDTVTIRGYDLDYTAGVRFGDTSAAWFYAQGDSILKAVVGKGGTGTVAVTAAGGGIMRTSAVFTYTGSALKPDITSFSPAVQQRNLIVSLYGKNLNDIAAVEVAGAPAQIVYTDGVGNEMAVKVGKGDTANHTIKIFTVSGADSIGGFTLLDVPVADSVLPNRGYVGDSITIYGSRFKLVTGVNIGWGLGTPIPPVPGYRIVNDSVIRAAIGFGNGGKVFLQSATAADSAYKAAFSLLSELKSFSPASGGKGTVVTLKGVFPSNDPWVNSDPKAVSFGGVPAASFSKVSDSVITAVVGSGATGPVSVALVGEAVTSKTAFIYQKQVPVIRSFSPLQGYEDDSVVIKGSGFTGATFAGIGGVQVAYLHVYNDSTAGFHVGGGATGTVSITTPEGADTTESVFTYLYSVPDMYSFSPSIAARGDMVAIRGNKLSDVKAVYFGGVSADSFRIVSSSYIQAWPGKGGSGTVKLEGYAGNDSVPGFTFKDAVPDITAYSPNGAARGDSVFIYGKNLGSATAVAVGGVPAARFYTAGDSVIVARIANNAYNDVSGKSAYISVTTSAGVDTVGGFTVYLPPVVRTVVSAAAAIDETVTITGENFTGTSAVRFGGVNAKSFTVVSSSIIKAVVDTGATGKVTVITRGGIDTSASFIFQPPQPDVIRFIPTSGKIGDTIIIYGDRFRNITSVRLGGTAATILNTLGDSLIYIRVNNGRTGVVEVTNAYGRDTLGGFVYREVRPSVTSFSPASGFTNDTVLVKGIRFTGSTQVTVGGVAAKAWQVYTDSTLMFVVGQGATGPIAVTTSAGSGSSAAYFAFTIPYPRMESYVPASAGKGDTVFIAGSNFRAVTDVYFGGIAADSFRILSDQAIKAWVGSGRTGSVLVSASGRADSLHGFTWLAAQPKVPEIISYSPGEAGPGAAVVIKGTHFTGTTGVTLGTAAAASFSVVSDSVIQAIVASNSATGPYSIIVTTPYGKDTAYGFVVLARPVVTSVTPSTATVGDTVVIKGTALKNTTAVYFGGKAAASFAVDASLQIRAVVDSGATGRVTIITPGGKDTGMFFTYLPPAPVITGFAPATASTGDTVNIYGKRLNNVTVAQLGVDRGGFRIVNDTLIKVVVVSAASSGYVYVANRYGADTSATRFVFNDQLPEITSFAPTAANPGKTVVIKGKRFKGAIAVRMGGEPAASFAVVSDSVINAVVANNANNLTGYIIVTTPAGKDTAFGFTVLPPAPAVTAVTPSAATAGETVVITGSNLAGATSVRFGGKPAASFVVSSASLIYAVVDSGATGRVTVITPNGTDTSASFTYLPPVPKVLGFTPATAKTGDTVTIYGRNFSSILSVKFGGVDAAGYRKVRDTTIQAVVGLGATGSVSVTTAYGTAQLGGFVYPGLPPAIYDFTPKSAAKGQTVRIWGTHLTGCKEVKLGDYKAASYVIESDSVIRAVVGEGNANAANRKVSLVTPGGSTDKEDFTFINAGVFNLTGFKAVLVNEKVHISWQTSREQYTDYFMLTWTAGSETVLQNRIAAAGFSDSVITYAFSYPVSQAGVNLITLRTHDQMGNDAFGDTASFTVNAEMFANVNSYPNPATSYTTIQHPASAGQASIMMFNMNGTLVRTQTVKPGDVQTTLYFSSLPKGMYKVVWTNGSTSRSVTLMLQ